MLEMIRKRNGNLVAFNDDKITNAAKKALAATGVPEGERDEIARDVTDCTISALAPKYMDSTPTVEDVQDEVERALIKMNLADTAKSYIIYRRKRQFMRDSSSMLNEQLKELFDTSAQESDLKRDNANVDGNSAMGTMLQVGAAASKSYYTENCLTDEQREANQSGDIHIHDFDFYNLTTTCTQIDLKKLFEHGFSTGHGYLREPQSIQSYAALACIAIQSNQNDQHGGQAVPNFDYALADGVRKTYAKEFEAAMDGLYEDMMDFEPGNGKEPVKAAIEATEMVPAMGDSKEFDERLLKQMVSLTSGHMADELAKIIRRAHKRALAKTDKATHQAMESLVHNLNSMHCLPASQRIWVKENDKISLMRMDEIAAGFVPGRYEVVSLNPKTGKVSFNALTAIQKKDSGRRLITMETAAGQTVTVTDNHRVMTANADDEKITIDAVYPESAIRLLSPSTIPSIIPQNVDISHYGEAYANSPIQADALVLNESLAELLGIYAGDGSIVGNDSQMALTVCEKYSVEEISKIVDDAFGTKVKVWTRLFDDGRVREFRFCVGCRIARMLRDVCGANSENKKVPGFILSAPDELRCAFLRGYFRTDGRHATKYSEAGSVSKTLRAGVRFLMAALGAFPTNNTAHKEEGNDLYGVSLGNIQSRAIGLPVQGDVDFEIPKYTLKFINESALKELVDCPRRHSMEIRKSELSASAQKENAEALKIMDELYAVNIQEKVESNSGSEYVYDISVANDETFLTEDMLFVHNSRAGAQVPFSSINYGTDTSPEGRMVIENVLKATMEGLGNGETPIFPIQIFKVKEGVNYNEGDPNYDLFKYSMKVSAKRLFPNYTFIDAPFNLQYYVPGRPETEIATMGCVRGSDYITFKLDGNLYVLPFAEAYSLVKDACGNELMHGKSKYVPCEGRVTIYDSNEHGFVPCKKFIKNPNQNNWMHLVTDNGRMLYATADHPLPVFGKGRTFMRDIEVGDRIHVSYQQYSADHAYVDTNVAWLLGLVLSCGDFSGNEIVLNCSRVNADDIARACAVIPGFSVITRGQKPVVSFGVYAEAAHKQLVDFFGNDGQGKRFIPSKVFSWYFKSKQAFLAGMMDGSGNAEDGHFIFSAVRDQHALAMSFMLLLESIGLPAQITESGCAPDAAYQVVASLDANIGQHIRSESVHKHAVTAPAAPLKVGPLACVKSIEAVSLDEESYDVETESDRFDVSGILSHNCRTRVMGNVHDPATIDENGVYHPNGEVAYGRGNLSFTSINLPRLAILADHDEKKFFESLTAMMELVARQLLDRLEIQSRRKVYNYPFLMGQGVWRGSDALRPTDEVREVLKNGTLSIGFIGLAETLTALYGHHHGESDEMEEKGLAIVKFMRDFCDRKAQETKLNFSLLATPAEGLSGYFVRKDKKLFGIIPGVTDRDYYTNSFHIPVWYNISAYQKIQKEAPFHALTNAGHITYVELDGDVANNLDAFESVVRCMHDAGIGYGSINHPVDRDPVCGYVGVIGDVCPRCGRRAGEGVSAEKLDQLRKKFPEMPYYARGIV